RRKLAVRSEQTLVDLHHALQDAFDWDDDHLYSFWLKGEFWGRDGSEYTHPFHAARRPSPLGPFATGPAPRTAETRLNGSF
ncbi:MAG: plasmid pRiA4b ORF-3 family protein, partial [Actinobacteria bacterium]|nr:plasmid pRiA4b ORF-3 family protein [Actinomycetota bacterium]